MINALSLVAGEGLLSLYPVLTRTVKANIMTQTAVRLITTAIICFPFITISVGSMVTQLSSHLVSLLYVFHIVTSYIAFLNLDVGVALTLFYTYPIINVLLHQLLFTKVDIRVMSYFMLAFLGAYMIARDSHNDHKQDEQSSKSMSRGVVAIILAAVTESLIYLFYKDGAGSNQLNPFNMLFIMCFTGGLLMLIAYLFGIKQPLEAPKPVEKVEEVEEPQLSSIFSSPITQLVIATIIIGVIGYLLRFYSVPRLSTEVYSVLSFSGIIFGYLYGWYFYGETITPSKLMGTLLILYCVYRVKMLGL